MDLEKIKVNVRGHLDEKGMRTLKELPSAQKDWRKFMVKMKKMWKYLPICMI